MNALLNNYRDSDEAASSMIDSEFFIKNILQEQCDKKFPILKTDINSLNAAEVNERL